MIRTQPKNIVRGQKRSFSNEQSTSDETRLHESQNDEIDVEKIGDTQPQIVQFETGKTIRGNLCLWHEGYCYTRSRGTNVINFRCDKRNCPATCKITINKQNNELLQFIEGTLGNNEHNHSPNPQKKLEKEKRDEILQKIVQMPKKKPSLLLADVKAHISDNNNNVNMGSDHALGHLIYRHKKRLFGNVDTANNILDIEFPEFLITCKGQSILLYDSRQYREGEDDVVLAFSHPTLLDLLEKNNEWLLYGNSCVPSKWSYNFIISTEVDKKAVVCVQCLLPKKSIKYYIEALNALKNAIEPLTPHKFISDFDYYALKAVNQVFPEFEIFGNMFYLSKNLLRKWRLLGMHCLYSDQILGKIAIKIFRNILTLSLIPPQQIRRAFYLIIQNSPIELISFLEYFAKNYIGLTDLQQQNGFKYLKEEEDLNLPIICPPKYSFEFWNINKRLISDIIRTNNYVDASNLIGKSSSFRRPPLSEFLTTFIKNITKQLEEIILLQQQQSINILQKKKIKRKRLYIIQEEQILYTLEQTNYENDQNLLDLITLLGLQIQGYVSGLRDDNNNDDEKGNSDNDEIEE